MTDDDTLTCDVCGAQATVRLFDSDRERGVYCERHAEEQLADNSATDTGQSP